MMSIVTLPLVTLTSAAVAAIGIAYFRKGHSHKASIVRAPYTEAEFPDEIYIQIFSHLQPEDLSRCGRVCRTWNVLTKSPELWVRHNCLDTIPRPEVCSRPGCIWCSFYIHMRNLSKLCGINPLAEGGFAFEPSPTTKSRLFWFRLFHYTVGLAMTTMSIWGAYWISNDAATTSVPPYIIPLGMALGFMSPNILVEYPKFRKCSPVVTALLGTGKLVYDLVVDPHTLSWGLDLLMLATYCSQTGRTLVSGVFRKFNNFLFHERFEFLYRGPASIVQRVFIAANVMLWWLLFCYFPRKIIVGLAVWCSIALLTTLKAQTRNSWFYFAAATLWNYLLFGTVVGLRVNLASMGLVAGFAGTQICLDSTQLLSVPYLATLLTFIFQSPSQMNHMCWILLLLVKLFFQKMFHQPVRDLRLLPCQFLLSKLSAFLSSFCTKDQQQPDVSNGGPIRFEGTDLDTSAYDSVRAVQTVRTRWLRGSLQSTHLRFASLKSDGASDGVHTVAPGYTCTHTVYSPLGFQSPPICADRLLLVSGDRLLAFTSLPTVAGVSFVKLLTAYALSELASCQIPSDALVSSFGKYFVAAGHKVQLFDLDSLTLIGEVTTIPPSAHTAAVALNCHYVVVATGEAVYTYQIIATNDSTDVSNLDREQMLVALGRFPLSSLKVPFSVHAMKLSSDGVLFLLNKPRRIVTAFDVTTMQCLYERKHVSHMGLLAGGSVVVLVRKDRFEILDPNQKRTMRKIEIENGLTPSMTNLGTPVDTSFGAGRYHCGCDFILSSNPCEGDRRLQCDALMLKADHVQ